MRRTTVFGAGLLATLTLASTAGAVTPMEGGWIIGTGEGGGSLQTKGSKIVKGATAPSAFKCNKVNAVIPKAITVASDGTFKYSGPLKGQSGTILFKGKFKTASTVSGSATITKGKCSSKVSWSGKPTSAMAMS